MAEMKGYSLKTGFQKKKKKRKKKKKNCSGLAMGRWSTALSRTVLLNKKRSF